MFVKFGYDTPYSVNYGSIPPVLVQRWEGGCSLPRRMAQKQFDYERNNGKLLLISGFSTFVEGFSIFISELCQLNFFI